MQTIWDWLSLTVFAGLAVLYLQRSMADQGVVKDRIIDYLPPAVACALANYLGNHDYAIFAVLLLIAALAQIVLVLKPFPQQH